MDLEGCEVKIPRRRKEPSIVPRWYQEEWCKEIVEKLASQKVYIDTSNMRTGKTYISSWVAQTLKLKMFVVCPANVVPVWEEIRDGKKLDFFTEIISYESLRGMVNSPLNHNWLVRSYDDNNNLIFKASDRFKRLVKKGVLLIFDEAQYIKNLTNQYFAAQALARAIHEEETRSRIGLLSGTLFTRQVSVIQILNMIGLLNSNTLWTYDRVYKTYNYRQFNEFLGKCRDIDMVKTNNIVGNTNINNTTIVDLLFKLYVGVIKNKYSGSACAPEEETLNHNVYNGFYSFSTSVESEKLEKAISNLENAVENVSKENKKLKSGDIKKLMCNTQIAKVGIITKLTLEKLEQELEDDKQYKVIVIFNYSEPIQNLAAIFANYDPIVITGSTKKKDRETLIEEFNTDPERRLLIANIKIVSLGISLHDTDGNYPRVMYIAPDYQMTDMIQAAYRVLSPDSKSASEVCIVYGSDGCSREYKLLSRIQEDSETLRALLKEEHIKGVKLPDEFPNRYF